MAKLIIRAIIGVSIARSKPTTTAASNRLPPFLSLLPQRQNHHSNQQGETCRRLQTIAQIINFAISRKREFLADASGVELTRNPEGLASALEKIHADTEPLEAANKATAHLYIANPLKGQRLWMKSLFSTSFLVLLLRLKGRQSFLLPDSIHQTENYSST